MSRDFFQNKRICLRPRRSAPLTAGLAWLLSLFFGLGSLPAQAAASTAELEERLAYQRSLPVESNQIPGWPQGPTVSASSAILLEAGSGAILYAKNIHQREYPASTTKILTALMAFENTSLDETVHMSQSAIYDTPRNSSHVAMDVGETLTMEDALAAILIASANEVSFAVAEHMSGTWQDFALAMNERAAQLGATDSHFVNPNGLPDDNHYTTAHDLAMIGKEFFSHDFLCQLSSSSLLDIPSSPTQPDHITAYCKNKLLAGRQYAYASLLGSKTGYTDTARNCLVSAAQQNGLTLICVVFREESPLQFEDTIALFDYGFANFQKWNIASHETAYQTALAPYFAQVLPGSRPLFALSGEDYIVLPKSAAFGDAVSSLEYDQLRDQQAARIRYSFQGVDVGQAPVSIQPDQSSFSVHFQEAVGAQELGSAQEPAKLFIHVPRLLFYIALGMAGALALYLLARFGLPWAEKLRAGNKRRRRRRPLIQTGLTWNPPNHGAPIRKSRPRQWESDSAFSHSAQKYQVLTPKNQGKRSRRLKPFRSSDG